MDREIDVSYRRKQIARRSVLTVALLCLVVAVFIWGPKLLKASVARTQIRTARVDAGPIESQITATGRVVPEFEQVLSSPLNARVLKVLKREGAILSKGEPILELDLNESRLAIEKINQQIELKQNQQAKARLDLESTLITLQSQIQIKTLELKGAQAASARNRELFKQGL